MTTMRTTDGLPLRVLFIAPSDSGLDVTPEIDSITDLGFDARPLVGTVTADRIFAVVRNSVYDILHFACHAGPDGVLLSGGVLFDIDSILQVTRMAQAKLVFLNGCETSIIGQTLIDENVPAVVVAMKDIRDDLAKQTAQAFYKHLAETGNMHAAYKASKPASRGLYQWLTDGHYQELLLAPIMERLDELTATLQRYDAEHATNSQEHTDLRREIAGLTAAVQSVHHQRVWFLRATVAAVLGVGALQGLFMVVTR